MTTWRARGIATGIVLVLLAGAFAGGRYSRPAHVVTQTVVKTDVQYRDVVHQQVVHDVAVQTESAAKVHTVVVTKWVQNPTGTTVTQETHQEASRDDKATSQAEAKTSLQREQDARQVVTETKTVTVTAARPNWSISAQAGAAILGGPRVIPGLPSPLVVGAQLDRRILGPLYAGVWANSAGMVGLSARLEL